MANSTEASGTKPLCGIDHHFAIVELDIAFFGETIIAFLAKRIEGLASF